MHYDIATIARMINNEWPTDYTAKVQYAAIDPQLPQIPADADDKLIIMRLATPRVTMTRAGVVNGDTKNETFILKGLPRLQDLYAVPEAR